MEISAAKVKELRSMTGAGIMDCKRALKESELDIDRAVTFLREKGLAAASKKAGRATSEGLVTPYIHSGGKIGVIVEVNCETDFVAKTDDFQGLTRDIAMHVAAMNPLYVQREDVPADVIEKEKDIYKAQAKE
ncbi:MAG: translation elongation factor Ts, partial [Deltaproteobacteria bacterium]|nr:translation elongation factor Ts [Deltaproteobacteria bacterium]